MNSYTDIDPQKYQFVTVCEVGELSNGERIFVEIRDFSIVVFDIAGEYYAIGDVCSHDEGPIGDGEIEQFKVVCPRHGARFDVRTGKALSLPAVVDIPSYPVKVINDQIQVGVPIASD